MRSCLNSKITPNSATAGIFDVTKSVEYWAAGADNFGWLIESAATNGWDFRTNNSDVASRPQLIIELRHAGGDGRLPNLGHLGDPGRRKHWDANCKRSTSLDWAIFPLPQASTTRSRLVAPGRQTLATLSQLPRLQALNFAANQALATIEVTINGDTTSKGWRRCW